MSQQQYVYGKHGFPVSGSSNGGYSQYSPNGDNSQLNTSPTFGQMYSISKLNTNSSSNMGEMPHPYLNGHEYLSSNGSPTDQHSLMPGSASSSVSSASGPEYSFYIPRLRYFLSKSFEMEDDLEFCPAIPENFNQTLLQLSTTQLSPQPKKFNPYTASVFSPTSSSKETITTTPPASALSPRVHTPRIRKPIEIINPQTRMRISSPALSSK